MHIDNAAGLNIGLGGGLFVNGPTTSLWASTSNVNVFAGTLGGTGRIQTSGDVSASGGSVLSSINAPSGTAYGGAPGSMVVTSGASCACSTTSPCALATNCMTSGLGRVESGALVSADWGTAMGIYPGARFELDGDGGWYQGSPVAGQAIGVIGNQGVLAKTGGGSTSVVNGNYIPSGFGHVEVDCCATLALAGEQLVGDCCNRTCLSARPPAVCRRPASARAARTRPSTR